MSEPTGMDEQTMVRVRIAAAMHANTDEKFGLMPTGFIAAGIIIAFIRMSFWPFVIAVVVAFFVSYFRWLLCFRSVHKKTGLPKLI